MKSKALIILSTIAMALALMAQSANQSSPTPGGDNAQACSGCNHDQADGRMACCGKGATCCGKGNACCKGGGGCCQGKDDKACPMMSKDQAGNATCCAGGKCSMTSKNSKACCGSNMCERPPAAS